MEIDSSTLLINSIISHGVTGAEAVEEEEHELTWILIFILTILILISSLSLLLVYLFDSRVFDEHGKQLPGPIHHFWGHNLWTIIQQSRIQKDYSKTIAEIFLPQMGDGNLVAYNWISGEPYLILGHPELAKAVLSGHSMKFQNDDGINGMKDLFGETIVTGYTPQQLQQQQQTQTQATRATVSKNGSDNATRTSTTTSTTSATAMNNKIMQHRHLLAPMLKSSNLKGLLTIFNIHSRRLVRHWNYKINKTELDSPGKQFEAYLDLDFKNLMIGIMCEASFGYDFFTHTNSKQVSDDFEIIVNEYMMRLNDPSIATANSSTSTSGSGMSSTGSVLRDWWLYFFPEQRRNPQTLQAITNMRALIDQTIEERLKKMKKHHRHHHHHPHNHHHHLHDEDEEDEDEEDVEDVDMEEIENGGHRNKQDEEDEEEILLGDETTSSSGSTSTSSGEDFSEPTDLLQILLNENMNNPQYAMSSIEIRDHIITFMILGYEVTASTLMSIFYELCLHPDIQQKCQVQLDQYMISRTNGQRMSTVLFEDIVRFTELIQVLKETLRLHPPIQMIKRQSLTQCQIGSYRMKAGCHLSISLLSLHKHPDYWYLPEEFYPERFSTENIHETIKHPYQYIPFGSGSKNCLGQRFAQMSIIAIASALLTNFSFELVKDDDHDNVVDKDKGSSSKKSSKTAYEEYGICSLSNLKVRITMRKDDDPKMAMMMNSSSSFASCSAPNTFSSSTTTTTSFSCESSPMKYHS